MVSLIAIVSSISRWILLHPPLCFSAGFEKIHKPAGYAEAHITDSNQQSSSYNGTRSELHCVRCHAHVGSKDGHTDGWRLYKWSLSVQSSKDAGGGRSFPAEVFICAQLLHLAEMQSTRRFVLHTGDQATMEAGLLVCAPATLLHCAKLMRQVWIFNPDMQYSNSQKTSPINRAMKIFYKQAENPQKLLDDHSTNLEELTLPPMIFQSFKAALEDSTSLLPSGARSFQEWKVGLIDRFTENAAKVEEQMAETWKILQRTIVENPPDADKRRMQEAETLHLIELSREALYG